MGRLTICWGDRYEGVLEGELVELDVPDIESDGPL
jgi:hypothetical protein